MNRLLVVILLLLTSGCATNQLHLAAYTSPDVLTQLRNAAPQSRITTIAGLDPCSRCTEMSKIVWHAANYPYEGFFAIPVENWDAFIRDSLNPAPVSPEAPTIEITIDRIFLKTWQNPLYYACQVELSVYAGGVVRHGKGVVKLAGPGQHLIRVNVVQLDPITAEAIRLALRAAYLDADGP